MRGPPAPPQPGHVVEVWWWEQWILGYWDGGRWFTADHSPLPGPLYWRERFRQ
jgi:hypothetical protein